MDAHALPAPRTLFLVEDEPSVGEVIRRIFRQDVVHAYEDGQAALNALEVIDPDVIICDLGIPLIDGPTLFQWVLLQRPELQDRFVFISGGACSDEHARFIRRSACPTLKKPFSLSQIRDLVEQVASRPDIDPMQRLRAR
jgi:DNA-binding NtrC family response regulator